MPLTQFEIAELLSDQVYHYAIRKLRNGLMRVSTFKKLINARFSHDKIDIQSILESLKNLNFIRIIAKESQLDPESTLSEKDQFILLVNDFLSIRKPSIEIQEILAHKNFHPQIRESYKRNLVLFFQKYKRNKSFGDDPDVLQIFNRKEYFIVVDFLRDQITTLDKPPKSLLKYFSDLKSYKEVIAYLSERNFVILEQNPKKLGGNKPQVYVILLTDIELVELFPEYMINKILEQRRNEKIPKELAIDALNILKDKYTKLHPFSEFPGETD
ncbi:MAG: hypothetical protein GF364_04160 [Candidatus Lokiarchaeota archaeon]|nr:hypothetical protein [Candidatus Lokiarchaeota archaeon]